jgi:adenylylsulfate kinase
MRLPGFVLWFTGLPGSGKSTVAARVAEALAARGWDVARLEMDARRKAYFPQPTYSDAERDQAYARFVDEAAELVGPGQAVLMDATAHRRAWRDAARARLPRFAEVFLRADLDTAAAREAARPGGAVMAGLYEKARERRATGREVPGLGPVPGVDEPYEENPGAECVLDPARLSPEEACARVLAWLEGWLSTTVSDTRLDLSAK